MYPSNSDSFPKCPCFGYFSGNMLLAPTSGICHKGIWKWKMKLSCEEGRNLTTNRDFVPDLIGGLWIFSLSDRVSQFFQVPAKKP